MRACDYKVFTFTYDTQIHIRISTCGGMDSEPTGTYRTERREYHCVAPTEAYAHAAYLKFHGKDNLISIKTAIEALNDIVMVV